METIGEIWLSTYMRNKGLSLNSISRTQKLGSIKTIDLDSLAHTLRTSEHRINIDWTKLWYMTIQGLINHINQYSPKAQTSYQDEGSKWLSDTFQKRFNINLNSLSANTALGAVSKMRDKLPALSIYLKQEKGIDISWTNLYGLQIQNLVTIINNQQAARNNKSATSSSTTGSSQTSKNASSSSSSKPYNSSNLNNDSNFNGHSTANSRHNKNFISDWDFEEATL